MLGVVFLLMLPRALSSHPSCILSCLAWPVTHCLLHAHSYALTPVEIEVAIKVLDTDGSGKVGMSIM